MTAGHLRHLLAQVPEDWEVVVEVGDSLRYDEISDVYEDPAYGVVFVAVDSDDPA